MDFFTINYQGLPYTSRQDPSGHLKSNVFKLPRQDLILPWLVWNHSILYIQMLFMSAIKKWHSPEKDGLSENWYKYLEYRINKVLMKLLLSS